MAPRDVITCEDLCPDELAAIDAQWGGKGLMLGRRIACKKFLRPADVAQCVAADRDQRRALGLRRCRGEVRRQHDAAVDRAAHRGDAGRLVVGSDRRFKISPTTLYKWSVRR